MDENRKVCPPASGVPEQTRRSQTGLWIAAAAIFLAGLCTAGAAFILGRRGVWAVGGLLACAGLGVLLCLTIGRIRSRALRRAVAALALEVACVPVVYFGFYCIFLAKILPTVIGVVLLIVALGLPVAGLIVGVGALSGRGEKRSALAVVLAVVSVILPILVAVVYILIFSTGLFIVQFM